MKRRVFGGLAACALLLAWGLLAPSSAAAQTFERGVVRITQNGREATLSVEIASSPAKPARRASWAGSGWRRTPGCSSSTRMMRERFFWMKNTRIPLSLAFIDSSGEVLEIIHLQPHKPGTRIPSYRSRQKVRRVLEVNQGWFLRNGFGLGARVSLE